MTEWFSTTISREFPKAKLAIRLIEKRKWANRSRIVCTLLSEWYDEQSDKNLVS